MAGRDIVEGLSKAAASAAKHPREAAEQALDAAVDTAREVVAKGAGVAERLLHRGSARGDVEVTRPTMSEAAAQAATEQALTGEEEPGADEPTPEAPVAGDEPGAADGAAEPPEPQVVLAEPAPPAEPPVDIVEQVLAAEAAGPRQGRMTEPKASTREEEHGDADLQRAEADELAEEVAESFPGGDLDIETPVGTTGADVGFNPDTAEADLQQPGTEPLVDPSLTKEVKAESDMLRRAAEGGRD